MSPFAIKPTEENLLSALKDNVLDRNDDLERFYNLLTAQESACSIALDGRWGSGKTFFVKQENLIINAMNSLSNIEMDKRNQILGNLKSLHYDESNQDDSALAIYYDAWQNDNDSDPIQSIIFETIRQIGMQYSFADETNIIECAKAILNHFAGRDISDFIEILNKKDPFDSFRYEKSLEEKFKGFFSEIIAERGNRLVIFIDELDRCNPAYAVRLLERVKHYFDDERITVVYSINSLELQHTIKHYYGIDFDGSRYLDRFFDIPVGLPSPNLSKWYSKIGFYSGDIQEEICKRIITFWQFELRDMSRFYQTVKIATKNIRLGRFERPEENARFAMIEFLVPTMIALKICDVNAYEDFRNGRRPDILVDLFETEYVARHLTSILLENDESYENADGKKLVSKKEKLISFYNAVFNQEDTSRNGYGEIVVGDCSFNRNSKNFVISIVNSISMYAEYN